MSVIRVALLLLSLSACNNYVKALTASVNEVLIPMEDGVVLAADLYVPKTAAVGSRYPVLLEYLPYRKDESRARNVELYGYFTDRGYIVARVDIRGTGRAEVNNTLWYSEIELADGETVIDWLSRQPWSSGKCRHVWYLVGWFQCYPNGHTPAACTPKPL